MIKHIVLWKLKDTALGATKADNALRAQRELNALADIVPGLRHIDAGVNFNPSEGAWDIALYSEFDSRQALEAYQVHPRHEAVRDLMAELLESRAVVDYEV